MLSKKYQEILRNLEERIDSKKDLEYVKEQFASLTMLFINELNSAQKNYENRINDLENKFDLVEKTISKIENDIYEDEYDLEPICCPYCNFNFMIEFDEQKNEITCPECDNIIELDWEETDNELDIIDNEQNYTDDDM